jgi:cytochrome b561
MAASVPSRYTRTAVLLHWLVAILVIGLLSIGFYMTGLERNTPERGWWFNLHKSIGVIALVLIMFRLFWRFTHPAPRLPESMPAIEKTAAHWSHWGLYVCMTVQALTGFVSSSLNRYGVKVFGLPLPKWGIEAPAMRDALVSIHHVVAWALTALVVVHVAAALKHAFWDRDGVMRRMSLLGD